MSGTTYRLRFPVSLEADDVTAFFGALSSELYGGRLPLTPPAVLLRSIGRAGDIDHAIELLPGSEERVLPTLRSILPAVRIEEQPNPSKQAPATWAIEVRTTTSHRPLRMDRAETIAATTLGTLADIGAKERLELQLLISGARVPQPARRMLGSETSPAWPMSSPTTWHRDAERAKQEREKQSQPQLLAVARIAAWTSTSERGQQLVSRVVRSLAGTQAPGVRLRVRSLPQWWTRGRLDARAVPWLDWPMLINSAELTSLSGWPVGGPAIPGLTLGASRQLPPSRRLSRDETAGAVIADSTFPGVAAAVVLRDEDRSMHCHFLGPTGSGKSVALGHVGISDMEHGHALIAIDPRGDLVDHLADHVPAHRESDVIVFDPSDPAPVGYNPLQGLGNDAALAVDQIDHIFAELFGTNYGPRSGDINRAALLTLASANTAERTYTLADVPALLSDPNLRRQLTTGLADPLLAQFWRWYDGLGQSQATVTAPLLNKLRALLLREPVRNVIGQATPPWSLTEVMAKRRILLVRLSAGEIGEESAQLIGSLLVAGIWQAARARTRLPIEQRRPVMVLIDEFQSFMRMPTSLGEMLAQARGVGLGLTLANQQLGQLSNEMQAEVLANARSRVVFQTNARDARTLAPHLPGLDPEDLQHLGPFEVAAQLAVGSNLAPTVTGKTRPPLPATGNGDRIKQLSRERFGTDREVIAAQLRERWTPASDTETELGDIPLSPPGSHS